MYCTYYGFQERPFNLTPNPAFIFLSRAHQEAFAHLIYGIENRSGFIMLTGEVGAGKTTVIRTLLTELKPETHATALILNPMVSVDGLLRAILREFGIAAECHESADMVDALNRFLLQQSANGRRVVLVIDEAQDMEPSVLEQVRLLSNLETTTDKLIQIILVGQPELETLMNRPDLRQLNQRITVRFHLTPMELPDTADYIRHRLATATTTNISPPSFTTAAVKSIYRFSGGLPRLINAAADRALLIAFNQNTKEVTATTAQNAISDIAHSRKSRINITKKGILYVIIALCLIVAMASFFYLMYSDALQTPSGLIGTKEQARNLASFPERLKIWQSTLGTLKFETNFLFVFIGLCASIATVAYYLYRARTPQNSENPTKSNTADQLFHNLFSISEQESRQLLLTELAILWRDPAPASIPKTSPEQALKSMGFAVHKYAGNLGGLIKLGYPALLECVRPQTKDKRYVLLTKASDDITLTSDALSRYTIKFTELERFWTGRALIPWKNMLGISILPNQNVTPDQRNLLGHLLRASGTWSTDNIDHSHAAIHSAIQKFQSQQGIAATGTPDVQTLMRLYQISKELRIPSINGAKS